MVSFNLSKLKNPLQESLVLHGFGRKEPITVLVAPFDTAMAFDCNRWAHHARQGLHNEADEIQFEIGIKRIVGWTDLTDETGSLLPFNKENLLLLSRCVEAMDYFMEVGAKTLVEAKVVGENFLTLLQNTAEPPAPLPVSPEASAPSFETPCE